MEAQIALGNPSVIAYVLLGVASLALALSRLQDVVGSSGRGRALYLLDLTVAVAFLFFAGRFSVLVATVPPDLTLVVVAAGLAAGLTGMATTGFVALVMVTIGGNGAQLLVWFVTPLLVGAALRNVRLVPERPPSTGRGLPEDFERWVMRPNARDLLWSLAARSTCVLPLVFVFLVPGDTDLRARIFGAVVLWVTLLAADRARMPLLISHRRAARTIDVSLFLVLLAVAAGPGGELISQWWAAHVADAQWYVMLAGAGVMILNDAVGPRFDRWRISWLLVRAKRFLIGLPQVALVCSALPFLIAGVFHPAQGPLESALVALLLGLAYALWSGRNGDGFNRQIADAWILAHASPRERKLLLAGWRTDNFYRRARRFRPWAYTNLPRIAGVLAHLGAESAHATTAVSMTLPWGEQVRLDHSLSHKFLGLAEQALDGVDKTFPAQMTTPGTVGHRIQQIARADLSVRRSTVAQYLDDFEGAIAASRQAADQYLAATAPAHAAATIIFTANRLSAVGQHEAAAELLTEVPDDLPPPVRRLLLAVRAAAAQRAGRAAAARSLLAAARAIPDRRLSAFRKVFLMERVKFPSYGEGAHKTLEATERELDRKLGAVTTQ
ncbi:hypothetical protein DL991_31665 [Amycolatopsis sp. WAC 01375]|uniref:hypothetical protein n=1 Tax=unclassified Amycolatopsis TaxID=2618356 RepID=UPI000F7B457A|nr:MULTISPECIES: hypothetical protein [unclassified Amycolatopsis]RSM73307.1 hypothetical protein DL991_31665 [Amycolatopsis sp. WAC 01375]RSN19906.1 hypothetical protein DL990_40785 [Amycolatopsis sp. WAC 01416]